MCLIVYHLDTSKTRQPRPILGCSTTEKKVALQQSNDKDHTKSEHTAVCIHFCPPQQQPKYQGLGLLILSGSEITNFRANPEYLVKQVCY